MAVVIECLRTTVMLRPTCQSAAGAYGVGFMNASPLIEQHGPRAVELRHRLHQIPELGYEEFKTAAEIRAELDVLRIPHIDGIPDAPTATIAVIGDPSKPCVALRADIDALPIEERTGLSYSSRHDGCMHACGHDGHIATLMGAAAVLKTMAAELPVCVKLIWQPAEEGGGGASGWCERACSTERSGRKYRPSSVCMDGPD